MMVRLADDSQYLNEVARTQFIKAVKNSGYPFSVVARMLDIKYFTLMQWKGNSFDFAEDNLEKVEMFNERFKEPVKLFN